MSESVTLTCGSEHWVISESSDAGTGHIFVSPDLDRGHGLRIVQHHRTGQSDRIVDVITLSPCQARALLLILDNALDGVQFDAVPIARRQWSIRRRV